MLALASFHLDLLVVSCSYIIYNDEYARILNTKHPAAMGIKVFDVWPEVTDKVLRKTFLCCYCLQRVQQLNFPLLQFENWLHAVLEEGKVWQMTDMFMILERPLPGTMIMTMMTMIRETNDARPEEIYITLSSYKAQHP